MSFREFITNFLYRKQVTAEFERQQNIKPPIDPSREHILKLIESLLNQNAAREARRELKLIGPAIVPWILAALNDPRFHSAEWKEYSSTPTPLDTTLQLLLKYSGEDVVRIATPLAKSSSDKVRKTVALHLANTGLDSSLPVLRELMQDEDGYVRSYVCIGLKRAVEDELAQNDFRRQAYDMLLPQVELKWNDATNDSAEMLVLLDPVRAAIDLASERRLNLSNPNTASIIKACNNANILLPESILRSLLSEALPLAVGERCYPNDYIAAAALKALAMRNAENITAIAESLLNHENELLREDSASALAILAGISDPLQFVLDRVSTESYTALSHEQRVVYCAFLFDAEVCNGGLMQFFGNSSGDYTVDTLQALSELQHVEGHTALQTAIRLVGPLSKEVDRELRLTAFEGRWDELEPVFDPLESAYYKSAANLRQAWQLYAVRHAAHFRR